MQGEDGGLEDLRRQEARRQRQIERLRRLLTDMYANRNSLRFQIRALETARKEQEEAERDKAALENELARRRSAGLLYSQRIADMNSEGIRRLLNNVFGRKTEGEVDADVRGVIGAALDSLLFREADLVSFRSGLFDGRGRTLQEAILHFSPNPPRITRERMKQIESRGYRKLRHHSRGLTDIANLSNP